MRLNDDLSIPVIVHAAKLAWSPSPAAGVERRMLYRVGAEIARATSIVRYAPGSSFPRHTHGGGEEILVLEGTFQDEHGDYPAGSYFRNPPGTSHIPAAKDGCVIFVRLWQFRKGDKVQIVRQPGQGENMEPRHGVVAASLLFEDSHERVILEDWQAGAAVTTANTRGLEFLLLRGLLSVDDMELEPLTWGRLPAGTALKAAVGVAGARIWLKDAPLQHPDILQLPA